MAVNHKKTLYVGGLAEEVDMTILSQKHKGFAFIEYQLAEDAADAIDNMDNGEILGRTIRVNTSKPLKYRENSNQPVWADDEYLRRMNEEKEAAVVAVPDEAGADDGD